MLSARQELSFAEYEHFHNFKLPTDGSLFELSQISSAGKGKFILKSIDQHQRMYESVE